MTTKYLQYFPKPVLEDLISGRWLPIVGAGMSRNAVLPAGKQMPLWADLGATFSNELGDYTPNSTLDAISAYEHEFGRPKLVERLSEALCISESRPGPVHQAFCSIPFDIVCTTNFDFLLERQYEAMPRNCTPLVEEEQLSVNVKDSGVALLKLHGDLRHPNRLVATETDYDRFLAKYPMLATYLANLLITRTAILVGYSLDDPDFRQVWQIVGERLGRSRRIAYSIAVGAKPTDVSRFERRGVKVINLPAGKSKYGDVLAQAFSEIADYWRVNIIPSSQVKEEQSLRELSLPDDAQTRLCFFAVPLTLLPFYRERVFPLARQNGFVPVTADDVVSPGDTVLPKIEALIARSLLIVIDASSEFTRAEYRLAKKKLDHSRILLITAPGVDVPANGASLESVILTDIRSLQYVVRPNLSTEESDAFLMQIEYWLAAAAERLGPSLLAEPTRLLSLGEYRAAVTSAISLLESTLRRRVDLPSMDSAKPLTLRRLLETAANQGLLGGFPVEVVLEWLRLRNEVVHGNRNIVRSKAERIVVGVSEIVRPSF